MNMKPYKGYTATVEQIDDKWIGKSDSLKIEITFEGPEAYLQQTFEDAVDNHLNLKRKFDMHILDNSSDNFEKIRKDLEDLRAKVQDLIEKNELHERPKAIAFSSYNKTCHFFSDKRMAGEFVKVHPEYRWTEVDEVIWHE